MSEGKIRSIAIHLPQFHPIPENDEWWGKGFTEWTNVTKARPLFKGHYQPQLPTDLGFYDLRLEESRLEQARLAKEYGINGFCYYHYWFNGRRILEQPVNAILANKKPDFPFCLCWANESWSRRWDGKEQELLIAQQYDEQDDRRHMEYLCREVFTDPRYIRVDGKPVFIVYRTQKIPDPKRTTDIWRETARKEGIGDIYLCRMEIGHFPAVPSELGFDAAIHFQPDIFGIPNKLPGALTRQLKKIKNVVPGLQGMVTGEEYLQDHLVYEYGEFAELMKLKEKPSYKRFPGIMPGWDNSPRVKKNAVIFQNSSPALYESWLTRIVHDFVPYSPQENFIFINAWNEWAEGNHLEPCIKWGRSYLEATQRALSSFTSRP